MLVIETNVSYDEGNFCDHQSRVIEVFSWEEYINTYIIKEPETYNGTMQGYAFYKNHEMTDLKYDDFHLSCNFSNGIKKLAYKLDDKFQLEFNKIT